MNCQRCYQLPADLLHVPGSSAHVTPSTQEPLPAAPLAASPASQLGRADGPLTAYRTPPAFAADKDGHISIADLDASLAHVAVCCPKTRCVYRCRRRLVGDLLRTVDLAGSRWASLRAAAS